MITTEQARGFGNHFQSLADEIGKAVLGKEHVVKLALTCLFSEGHLLLEDLPGTGKTMLARALAASVEGSHARIQFTPDLLPTDVTGVTVYDQHQGSFSFHPGPVCSIGFWVAMTRNGRGTGRVTPSTVTCPSSITSSMAAWVLGEARLISSANTMSWKTGPGWKEKLPWCWS